MDNGFPNAMADLRDFQEFHKWLDAEKGFSCDLFVNILCLVEEVGEVSEVLADIRSRENLVPTEQALAEKRTELGDELADCLAYLLKLATSAGIDLHEAYLNKQARNIRRTWSLGISGVSGT